MAFAGASREGLGMRQPYTHAVSIQEWTSDAYEGASHTQSSSTPFLASSQHEVLQRVKTTSKPLRSSPLAGPALSGDRTSIPTETTSTLSKASSSRSFRPRSILLTEPLSCFLRSKSSQSMAQPSSQKSGSSSSPPPSSAPPIHLSPSQSPSSLDRDHQSALYRPSVTHPTASDASTSSTTISNLRSPGNRRPRHLMIDTSHTTISHPPTVITSPTDSTFRPHSAPIYTPPNSGSSPPSAQPHTPPPPHPRSRLRLGERTTLDARIRTSESATAASTSDSLSAPLSPSTSAIRHPPPTRPKSILKNPSASRHSSSSPLAETPTAMAPARSPVKDNSWYVNSPYTITPPFTRLGLNAPGVVLPLSVKEYRRRTAMAALAGGGAGAGERGAAKGRMGRSASAGTNGSSTSGTGSILKQDRRTSSSISTSPTSMTSYDTQPQSASGGSRTDEETIAELLENAESNDAHIAPTTSAVLDHPEMQPHWLTLPPYSQSQSHAGCDQEPRPSWTRAQSQSSAASSVSSLPLTLPSSVPDSILPSQTPSVRSATETSSVCTSVTGTGIDEKSEETVLPHDAHVEAMTPVPEMVEIPALALKKKRKSVLATMRSFCWTGTGPAADADAEKPVRVQHGSTNVVNLPLPVATAAPTERRAKTRRSMPLLNKLDWNHDTATVPITKTDATPSAVEKNVLHVPAAAVALVPAAELSTPEDGHLHRVANRSGNEKKLKDAGVEVEVRYIDVGIVSDSGLRKSQAATAGQRRNGSVRKVWDSLRGGGGRRGPQAMV